VVNASSSVGAATQLNSMYAITRYTQAIQSRGTKWPIKFNGMAFVAAMGEEGEAEYRDWGSSNWWQNTRLPYGAMLAAGDFEEFKVILDYISNQEVFLGQRTLAYWNHTGMWTTETTHLTGAYDNTDYGCSRGSDWPNWLMQSGYLHVDQGGDSGTGEYPLMALDYLLYTGDPQAFSPYLKIPLQAANYFMYHYNKSADGSKVVVYPAQVLETYWCDWNGATQSFQNCCADDSPTVSGMITLFNTLLSLPHTITTPAQRAEWEAFLPLIPELPVDAGNTTILPARVISSGSHNSEGPELYAIHPHRVFTKGKEVASGLNISLALSTFEKSGWAHYNSGWNYGINAAALLGLAADASEMMLQRAATGPAPGYRWPGFAPHEQDFDPSADCELRLFLARKPLPPFTSAYPFFSTQYLYFYTTRTDFANMNRCLQEMLIQSGDDGFENPTIVLFPAWPCNWDASFKLWGPLNTTIQVQYAGGKLLSMAVEPPSRASSVKWANCVPN